MYVQSWSFGRWQFPSLPHLGHCLRPAQPQASNLLSRMVSIQTQTFVCKSLNLWHLRTTYSGSQTWIWNLFLQWHKDAVQRALFLRSPVQPSTNRGSPSFPVIITGACWKWSNEGFLCASFDAFLTYVCLYISNIQQASQVETEKPVKLQEPLVPKTVQVKGSRKRQSDNQCHPKSPE